MTALTAHRTALFAAVFLALAGLFSVGPVSTLDARDRQVPPSRAAVNYSFAPIVKQSLPAVVNVHVRQRSQRRRRYNPFAGDPFFERFFGDSFGIPRERIETSLGSGVIVDPKGLVVTNHHVIQGAVNGEIKVSLPNRKEYEAEVILKDKGTDLAVLRLLGSEDEDFPHLDIANSDDVEVGDLVLAMGNPFGVGQTVTSGIVSALARTNIAKGGAQYFIQTDAAINPGNSGGALLDIDGRLIGINTAIFSKSGGSLGIGFAIPSNMVRLVINSARSGRSVRRPWFGGRVKTVSRDIADGLGLTQAAGVYVSSLADESPARNAGLQVGDVITTVNDQKVLDEKAFRYHYTINGTGGVARLGINRGGRLINKRIRLVKAPENPPRNVTRISGRTPFSGAVIANLSPALAEEIAVSDQSGVIVLGLGRRSFARRIGLVKRDILLELNGVEIDSVATLKKLLRERSSEWRFTVKRGNNILSMSLGG